MRKFRFRLQSILRLREYTEREKKLALGEITGRCSLLRQEMNARDAERYRALRSVTRAEESDIAFRRSLDDYAFRMEVEKGRIAEELAAREEERAIAAAAYHEAHQKAEVLRKLRDHRSDAYRHDQLRAEQLVLDETARTIHMQNEVNHG